MRTYEKPFERRNRGPNYAGVIAVSCLLVSMLAAWAVMKTGAMTLPTVTLAQSDRAK
ncbi:MAG TPA: hypothetical protein VKS24_15480 [Bradyrhizobium sp.]|nr:hypothetical protein [Bradyrhizobium sp.]